MGFSELTEDERLAGWAAIAVTFGGLVAVFSYTTYSGAWIGVIAAFVTLAVILVPQLSPGSRIPGAASAWLLVSGSVAALVLAVVLVVNVRFVFTRFTIADFLFLVAVAGGFVMAWAGWRVHRAEPGAPAALPGETDEVATEDARP